MEFRLTTRDAFCRGCDQAILKNTEEVFYTYSYRNQGQSIFLCRECVAKVIEMFKESADECEV